MKKYKFPAKHIFKILYTFFFSMFFITALILLSSLQAQCGHNKNGQFILFADKDYRTLNNNNLLTWINSLKKMASLKHIVIIEPLPNTVFPIDLASPVFSWEDEADNSAWLITIKDKNDILLKALLSTQWWIPDADTWNRLKKKAGYNTLEIIITGIGGWTGREIISQHSIFLNFSKDKINAKLMFMRKPLPFLEAKKKS